MGVLNTPGDDNIRAATADWQSLNHILEQSVPGFAEITDENNKDYYVNDYGISSAVAV